MTTRLALETLEEFKLLQGFFVWYYVLLFLILLIYKHSCIVYLQVMRPRGVFAWHWYPWYFVLNPCMDKVLSPLPFKLLGLLLCMRTQLYSNLLVRFNLLGPPTRSLVMWNLLSNLYKWFELSWHHEMFQRGRLYSAFWDRSKVRTIPNHYNHLKSYQCRLSKQYRRIQSEFEYLGCICSAVYEHFFNAIDLLDYHPSKHVTPNPQSSKSTNYHRSRRRVCSSCKGDIILISVLMRWNICLS